MKKKVINDKGITLISVVIIVIILLILAGVATVSGISTVRFARFTAFRTELQLLQNEVNGLKQEKTNEELASLGTEMTAEQKQIFDVSEVSSVLQGKGMDINTLENGFKYFSEEYLTDDLKIDGMTRDYYINLQERIIIATEPVTYENVDYYMLEQMENGGYNVQYNNQTGDLSFQLETELMSNNKGKIRIFNITYPGYIEKWEAQYRVKGTENWNSAGEFTGDNYEFEVTQAGTYEVRLIHEGEVESGIQIAEISQKIVTASDLANATDKTNIYGATVTNYETADSSKAKADGWKIFYAGTVGDETTPYIYLIASDYIEYQYIPYSTKNGVVTTNKPSQGNYPRAAYLSHEIIYDYTGVPNITNMEIQALNYNYFSQDFTSTNFNMKSVAYMLDTEAWKDFAGSNAKYVIGGPTIELLMNSYSQKYKVDYRAQASNSIGYQISNDGGVSWSNSINKALNTSDSTYVINNDDNAYGMWIASPSSYDSEYVIYIDMQGGVICDFYDYNDLGFRPIVCLKADTQLERNSDGTYTIIDNSEPSTDDYIKDGLILYYDAINNTGNGHDANSTVWKDLSGNGNDGKLVNINNTADSGWQEDGLKLDGIDDYVEISPDKLKGLGKGTVIVDFEFYDWNPDEQYNTLFFLGNQLQWNYNHIQISEDLYTASRFNTTVSNNKESTTNKLVMDVDLNQYKQIALTWNGTTVQNFNNGIKESSINSTITPANDSTVCYLGRNYYADTRNLNCKISSVKIYNRDLTEEEIQKTYELDNERYKMKEETSTNDYIQDGLVLHLDGINNTGEGDTKHNLSTTVWKDLSGNNNDATLQNVNFGNAESGWRSNCLKLDGVDDYAAIVDSETMKPDGQTIEIVFNRTGEASGNTDSSRRGIIFVRWHGYTVELNAIDANNTFSMSYGRTNTGYLQSSSRAQLNKKYHIGATYQNNVSKMYLNSAYESEQSITPAPYDTSMNEARIGQYNDKAYTKANIYAIRMYNRALSEEEMEHNYNIDKIRFGLD